MGATMSPGKIHFQNQVTCSPLLQEIWNVWKETAAVLDGEHAVGANLLDRLGNHLANLVVVPRGDGRNRLDVGAAVDGLGHLLELVGEVPAGLVDAAVDGDGVRARGDGLEPEADHLPREHRRGGGAVAGGIVGAARHLLDELGAGGLDGVGELDGARDGDAVVDDLDG